MTFDLEMLFTHVFAPQSGDIVSILYDLPHGEIADKVEWQDRRVMAENWHRQIRDFADRYGLEVKPIITYAATGSDGSDMPEYGMSQGEKVHMEDALKGSTIIISMPQFSASANLIAFAKKHKTMRVASMPMLTKGMQKTGLSADYHEIARTCDRLAPLFERAIGVEVTFSTGHTCYFDISAHNAVVKDTGLLHPCPEGDTPIFGNLPAGEVFICPNEAEDSRTAGYIPAVLEGESLIFVVQNNQIVEIKGEGPVAAKTRAQFKDEPALRGIAEVAIGCNDKAAVTGNVLEDEKAGFHWAYGRSDHIGGTVGVNDFSSPEKVNHKDIVYAKGNPIVCARLDFVDPDGTRKTVIRDGILEF